MSRRVDLQSLDAVKADSGSSLRDVRNDERLRWRADGDRQRVPWYRVPVAWLGLAIFAASIAGCAWIIVAGVQYRDPPLAAPAHSVLGVPAHVPPAPARS